MNINCNLPESLPKCPLKSAILIAVLASLVLSQSLGQAKDILIDGFESGLSWEADNTNDAVVLTVVQTNATEGTRSLLVAFPNHGKDKVIIHRSVNRDLTSISSLVSDALNPQTNDMEVAIALQTGSKWEWFESRPAIVKPGLNQNVRFDLTGKNFKSDRTETLETASQYTDALSGVADLQRVSILIYTGTGEQVNLYLDNVRWEQSDSKTNQTIGSKSDNRYAMRVPEKQNSATGEMLVNGNFMDGINNWVLEQTEGATGRIASVPQGPDGKNALRIQVQTITNKAWHLQLYQTGPRVEKGRTYELTFWAKSDRDSNFKVVCAQNHAPWEHHTQELLPLSTEWKQLHFTFVAPWSDDNLRICFTDLGAVVGQVYWLAKCSLMPVTPTKPDAAAPAKAESTSYSWSSDCSAESTYVNSHHPTIPGHYEYVPDPDGKGMVFRGHLSEDFKVEDPQKVHLHPEIYFNEFHPGNFSISFEVRVDDLLPNVLGPYTDKPWLNVVTAFDRTKLTGDANFNPSVMVNIVGSPGAYFLQTYSMSPAGEGTFFEKLPSAPIFPTRKWVLIKVEVDVSALCVRTYQDGILVSEGPYKTRPGLAGLHMGLYTNRLMQRATVYNRNVKISVQP